MTTLIAWLAVDHRGPTALYLASDSRITWRTAAHRWEVGRKLFSCHQQPDIFGYAGDVLFPSLALGQAIEFFDNKIFKTVEPDDRHADFVGLIKSSFAHRHNAPTQDFRIVHGMRIGSGMESTFRIWILSYSASINIWTDYEIIVPAEISGLLVAIGSGASNFLAHSRWITEKPQGGTSRAVFWAFCDALRSGSDRLSGGSPQLVGIYRKEPPRSFGIVFNGGRYFHGLPVDGDLNFECLEWRDESFQRVNGETMNLIEGGQRHGRP